MPRVVVIGRRADALPFRAAGVELVEVTDPKAADAALASLAESTEPCMVMMTEDLVEACAARVLSFRKGKMRAILAVPSLGVRPGKRMAQSRALVARSLGVDILGRYINSMAPEEGARRKKEMRSQPGIEGARS